MISTELKQWLAELLNAMGGASDKRADRPLLDALFSGAGSSGGRAFYHLLQQTYGGGLEMKRPQIIRLIRLCDLFVSLYGDGEVTLLRAPARINILGEHVDYVSYLPTASLPFGSREHDMLMLCWPSETMRVRGASTLREAYQPFQFDFATETFEAEGGVDIDERWHSYLFARPAPLPGWGNYVKGAVLHAVLKYGDRLRAGFDFVVDSTIPAGGGASSSSALMVLAGAAIRLTNRISYAASELAEDSSRAEWFVGTRGGAMDHLTICLARPHHAIHISYDTGKTEAVRLPDEEFRWVTFFSHPADKGREVMLEYNERAAVSRLIIPALIEQWAQTRPEIYRLWESAGTEAKPALDDLQQVLMNLPDTRTLGQLEQELPEVFRQCELAFPALITERFSHPLKIRDRALHHIGEVRRVAAAIEIFCDASPQQGADEAHGPALMRAVGALLDQSHESLCSLYDVCTPEVDELIKTIAEDPYVYGARLMGGGFGGNVLALTTEEHLSPLIESVQTIYYGPRERAGVAEGSVMISTPGAGLAVLDPEEVWRHAIHTFNTKWWEADRYRQPACALLDDLASSGDFQQETWPVVVAAGKGMRAAASGLTGPKPLAEVSGVPAITHMLHNLKEANPRARPPVVIISPEMEEQMRESLSGEVVEFVVQSAARGTGDAVLCAFERMSGFAGRALVAWGTQPVIRPQTIRRSLQLAALFKGYRMIVPTAVGRHPYAPLRRNHRGQVCGAWETHLERAPTPRFGETNVGLFILDSRAMFEALKELKGRYWRADESRYDRPGNELGFPNELITLFAQLEGGVLASPIADWREQQGIKSQADIERCERFICELGG